MTNIQEFKAEVLKPAEDKMREFGLPVEQIKKETSFAIQIVNKNKLLRDCTTESLLVAVVNIAQVGLTLNPIAKEAYLIPRYNGKIKKFEAHLEPSYIGLIKLITDAGSITSIQTNLVYDNDEFQIIHGLTTDFRHVPILKGERGSIVGVYSVASVKSGEKVFEYMNREEVEKIRDYSDSWRAYTDPEKEKVTTCIWKDSEGEMYRKTVVKRIQKYLPRTNQMQYVDNAVKLSNSDWEASSSQIGYAEALIDSSTLIDSRKEDLYKELATARSYDVEMMIEYLLDCQQKPGVEGDLHTMGEVEGAVELALSKDKD